MNKFTRFRLVGELEAAPSGKLLYLLLTDTADADGVIIISQKKISTALGISKGTVSRNLRKLKKCGYIDIVPTFHDDGGRAANKYYVFD